MIQEYYLKTIDSNQYSRQSIQLPLVYNPETHTVDGKTVYMFRPEDVIRTIINFSSMTLGLSP